MSPKVVIIVLNWNRKQDSLKCLRSLQQIEYPNYEVLFVDNGSDDDSVACVSRQFPEIHIIKNHKNLGYAEGNNVGIRWALEKDADYIFLLNNDTIVDRNILNCLVSASEQNREIGIVGPKIYYSGAKNRLYSAGGNINFREFVVKPKGYNQEDRGQFDEIAEVDFIVGCGLLIKRKVIEEIGLLDPIYFSYFEDVDWCIRAKDREYKIIYVPKAKMWHRVAASSGGNDSPQWNYLMGRSAVIFMSKYGNLLNWLKFITFLSAEILWGIFKNVLFHRQKPILSKIRGLRDGFFQKQVNYEKLKNDY